MKTRNDFVSNSSSTSFIIYFENEEADFDKSKLDDVFFKLLSRCYTIFFKSYEGKKFSEDLIAEIKTVECFKIDDAFSDGSETIMLKLRDTWHGKQLADLFEPKILSLAKRLCTESAHLCCDFGCDDCGEYIQLATQICTLIELKYGLVPEGDDHFDYTSLRKLVGDDLYENAE